MMSSTKSRLRVIGALAALAALALAVSCKGFFPGETLGSFTISPSTVNVPLGATAQLHAFGTNTDGSSAGDVTGKVTWSAPENAPVSVVSPGLLKGIVYSASSTTITAAYQALPAVTATANVCVDDAPQSSFQIAPSDSSVAFDGTLTGSGFTDSADSSTVGTVDLTAATQWTSSNTSLLTITSGSSPAPITWGSTAPTSNTTVVITATYTCNGVTITATTKLTVTPPG